MLGHQQHGLMTVVTASVVWIWVLYGDHGTGVSPTSARLNNESHLEALMSGQTSTMETIQFVSTFFPFSTWLSSPSKRDDTDHLLYASAFVKSSNVAVQCVAALVDLTLLTIVLFSDASSHWLLRETRVYITSDSIHNELKSCNRLAKLHREFFILCQWCNPCWALTSRGIQPLIHNEHKSCNRLEKLHCEFFILCQWFNIRGALTSKGI